ncbi:MAG: hypothetical protein QOJ27_2297, partial [Sphingomonadales bacterium]|nr:hypothetical protein [Sphingomonadales bacterium]
MATAQASQAKASALATQALPAPPLVQRRSGAGFVPPVASLAAVPALPVVQRTCEACGEEEREETAVQPRLEVGPVGDRFEREADSIAGRVMAMRGADVSAAAPMVQRACAACSASPDEPHARRLSDDEADSELDDEMDLDLDDEMGLDLDDEMGLDLEDDDEAVRARHASSGGGPETIRASHHELTEGGSPLTDATQSFFEPRMGRDLSDVRVHQGVVAEALNTSILARAFTYRNHVWLGAGESAGPSFTMAHELAHVMQQTAPGPVGGRSASVAPSTIQRQLRPPGNCIQGIHDEMQRQVKIWCDHPSGRTCVAGESCNRLRQKIRRNQMCARNRRLINVTCYNGGDIGHRIAERDARRAQANCMALFRAQCERRPVPVPVPVPLPIPAPRPVPVPVPVPVSPIPVPPRSTWDIVAEWARQVASSGENPLRAAERLIAEHPNIAGTVAGVGVVAIIALIADDLTGAG